MHNKHNEQLLQMMRMIAETQTNRKKSKVD